MAVVLCLIVKEFILGNDLYDRKGNIFLTIIIYSASELASYDSCFCDEHMRIYSERAGKELTRENVADIKQVIDSCLEDERYAQGRQEVQQETWAYAGEGAVRAAEYLIAKHEELTSVEGM